MGHWNHRVVRRTIIESGEQVEWFGIHEVFYGTPEEDSVGWTENAISVEGESVDELRETLQRMLKALDKPPIIDTEPTE